MCPRDCPLNALLLPTTPHNLAYIFLVCSRSPQSVHDPRTKSNSPQAIKNASLDSLHWTTASSHSVLGLRSCPRRLISPAKLDTLLKGWKIHSCQRGSQPPTRRVTSHRSPHTTYALDTYVLAKTAVCTACSFLSVIMMAQIACEARPGDFCQVRRTESTRGTESFLPGCYTPTPSALQLILRKRLKLWGSDSTTTERIISITTLRPTPVPSLFRAFEARAWSLPRVFRMRLLSAGCDRQTRRTRHAR